MTRHEYIAALVIIVALNQPLQSVAAGSGEPTIATGAGTRTCSQFAQDYASNPNHFETIYFAWAQGFMSGTNLHMAHMHQTYRNLATSTDAQEAAIRDYCNRHPLADYWEAVFALFHTLPQRKS